MSFPWEGIRYLNLVSPLDLLNRNPEGAGQWLFLSPEWFWCLFSSHTTFWFLIMTTKGRCTDVCMLLAWMMGFVRVPRNSGCGQLQSLPSTVCVYKQNVKYYQISVIVFQQVPFSPGDNDQCLLSKWPFEFGAKRNKLHGRVQQQLAHCVQLQPDKYVLG